MPNSTHKNAMDFQQLLDPWVTALTRFMYVLDKGNGNDDVVIYRNGNDVTDGSKNIEKPKKVFQDHKV